MLTGLLSKMTAEEVNYAFEHKIYFYSEQREGLREFLDWFTDSDIFAYLVSSMDGPDYFTGSMTCLALVASVAIKSGLKDRFESFVGSICWEFAKSAIYEDHEKDCVYDYLNSFEADWVEALSDQIRLGTSYFFSGFYDMMQILYSYESIASAVEQDFVDCEDGEIIEEVEEWPELIG